MILQIAKLPPPIGGVTTHVKRLLASLKAVENIEFAILDYSKERNVLVIIHKIANAKVVHLHVTKKVLRLFLVLFFRLLSKKVLITFHGNYNFKNILDIYSLKYSDAAILLNQISYKAASNIRISKNYLIGAFIPPIEGDIAPLDEILIEKIGKFKSNFNVVYSTNAYNYVRDDQGKETYMGSDLVSLFTKNKEIGLIFSDPTGNYYKYLIGIFKELPNNVLFITQPHDFINIIKATDALIRATTTDGDSLSVKEALYFNKTVIATGVVDRPNDVLIFNNLEELQYLISNKTKNNTHSEVKNNFDDILKVYIEMNIIYSQKE
ncbi:hypothetical protein [Arenibacter sp. S6351L]|uniref:hypothetical protein n=1 Tax=Arenibacter sp. S6351L TaxID=2926407 RepID=UPI001FF21396|nr:hypothetical protein [Arenibacter sp. S6351L]MCK0137246.1 hypothetical protein [Arenibacter sp. S6351L]